MSMSRHIGDPAVADLARDTAAHYERFITTVAQKARLSWEAAERAAVATLSTLADRLSAGEARDLAAYLPAELRAALATDDRAEPFRVDQFLRRVAQREGIDDLQDAERHARAVLTALAREVPPGEWKDMTAELPNDFEPLLADVDPGPRPQMLAAEEFLASVADRAATDETGARRATEAVLETLGERVSGGEVDDLAALLAPELRPALHRGNDRSGGKATRMSLDDFVRAVAEHEGVGLDQAHEHARAVFATLREAISEKEFRDLTSELPDDYRAITGR
jgi:uncharacterized protein (DUF2267 family)